MVNVGHGKSTLGRVGGGLELINHPQEEQDIMCGGGSGYSVLWSLKGRGVFPHTIKGGVEVLGRCHTKEGVITRGGDPSESIKRICRRKVAHGAIGGLNVLRD